MGLFAVVLAGCAHTREEVRSATVTAEPTPETIEREVIAIESAPPPRGGACGPAASRADDHPRSGGGASVRPDCSSAGTRGRREREREPNSSIVVNNNIVVQGGAPAYYGGYGYGGYGGYGRATGFYGGESRSFGAAQSTTSQWGATGWEGARRTAAPGQTPGVGGNWSPAPSYGPAQMK